MNEESPKKLNAVTEEEQADDIVEYKTECYRWLILLMVTLVPICAIMTFVSLMPISVPIAESYNLSVLYVNSACYAVINVAISVDFSEWYRDG